MHFLVLNLQENFQALLAPQIDSGDETLQGHHNAAPRNAQYISNIWEEFIEFYLCEGETAGVAIKQPILQAIADSGLSFLVICC